MPTELPARRTKKKLGLPGKIVFILAIGLLIWLSNLFAARGNDVFGLRASPEMQFMQHVEREHSMPESAATEKRPGYYGYLHDVFHEPFYSKLKKWNTKEQKFSDSCCSGDECRATEPLRDATSEFKAEGYTHMVLIDGDWYPIRLVEKQTGFTPDQLPQARKHPLFQDFVQLTHVCAYRLLAPSEAIRKNPVQYKIYLKQSGGSIYCVLDGGDKG